MLCLPFDVRTVEALSWCRETVGSVVGVEILEALPLCSHLNKPSWFPRKAHHKLL